MTKIALDDSSLRFSLLELDDAPAASQEWDSPQDDTTPGVEFSFQEALASVKPPVVQPTPRWVGRLGGPLSAKPGSFRRTLDHDSLDSLASAMPEFNATVAKEPLYTSDGIEVPNTAVTVRTYPDGRREPLAPVGARYKVIQDSEALGIARPLMDDGTIRNLDGGRYKGKIWLYGQSKIKADIRPGDSVEARIIVANSHDGTIPWSVGFPCVRPVCQNTLAHALSSSLSKLLKIRHTKNAQEIVDQVRMAVDQFRYEFIEAADKMALMARTKVTESQLKDYVGYVFQPSKWAESEAEGTEESDDSRVYVKVLENYESGPGAAPGTLWGAYNAVTQYLTHDRSRAKNPDATFADLQWGNGALLNKRAFEGAVNAL